MSLLDWIADRIQAHSDEDLRAQGLTVTRLPGGGRRVHHPDLPALLEARRRRMVAEGLDLADRMMLDPGTLATLDATRERMDASARRFAA